MLPLSSYPPRGLENPRNSNKSKVGPKVGLGGVPESRAKVQGICVC